ncbi:hypothetical protein POPTR_002G000901v4 [Populus trichocarpa]|uniref:Uncharacterized protein n=1 Tax=Populus trichocarpa TaxID=3694 RepID=A0ACC0TB56_POPTR|nr:hypothetical protein BDE02_02G001000 [Populus trichocarpa]KAI9398770.1 hypothetical protein POPTR_002G000901v4 [Populus trichocarpa]
MNAGANGQFMCSKNKRHDCTFLFLKRLTPYSMEQKLMLQCTIMNFK